MTVHHEFELTDLSHHNWWRKLQQLADTWPMMPGIQRMAIRHDTGCAIWAEKYCNCDPTIEIAQGEE